MTQRWHATIIDEYLFLKRKVAKCIVKSKGFPEALITNRTILKKARKLVKRMLEIEGECQKNGWGHPDAYDPELASVHHYQGDGVSGSFDLGVQRLLTRPDGTLYQKAAVTVGGEEISNKVLTNLNPDGTLFETPPLEGSFVPRRGETD